MKLAVCAIVALAGAGGCACGSAFELDSGDADSAMIDADARASEVDAGTDVGMDAGICDPLMPPPGCDSDSYCVAWAAYVAPPGTYPVTRCLTQPNGFGLCQLGVSNCVHTAFNAYCGCSTTMLCDHGPQVCVSDTPGGPTRCTLRCAGH